MFEEYRTDLLKLVDRFLKEQGMFGTCDTIRIHYDSGPNIKSIELIDASKQPEEE